MKNPKISILIPCLNEEKNIEKLIDDLINLDYKNYKIIVIVDSKTRDNTYKIVKDLSKKNNKIKVILNQKTGSAANRNLGYRESDKDTVYYAFTDGDCRVTKDWLKILVRTIEKAHPSVVCVGGINLISNKESPKSRLFSEIEQKFFGAGGTAQTKIYKKITEVNSIANCNALYKREVWEKNKQDESLIKGQDGEFNHRIHEKGGKFLINPEAIVFFGRPNTLKKHLKRFYGYGEASSKILKKQKNKLKFILKRWYGFLPPLYFLGIIVLVILSLINTIFLGILIVGILSYMLIDIITTLQTFYSFRKIISITTIWILPLQHLAYSLGVIKELIK